MWYYTTPVVKNLGLVESMMRKAGSEGYVTDHPLYHNSSEIV